MRKILNARQEALQFISYSISANSLVKAWHDPWLTNSPLINRLGTGIVTVMESTLDASVCSLIDNHQWNVSMSNDYRAVRFREMLNNFPISASDSVLWNGDSQTKVSVVWNSIRQRSSPKPWLPLLWHKFHIPACSFICWLACLERLLTKDRMLHLQMEVVDLKCVLCRSYDENTAHLFSSCPYTYVLLRECPYALNIHWQDWLRGNFFQDDLTKFQKNIGFLYLNIVIYHVWQERNTRNHDKGILPVAQMGFKIKRMFREKLYTSDVFRKKLTVDPSLSQILY